MPTIGTALDQSEEDEARFSRQLHELLGWLDSIGGAGDGAAKLSAAHRRLGSRSLAMHANMRPVQTRYLILASLITGIVILIASAIWLTRY